VASVTLSDGDALGSIKAPVQGWLRLQDIFPEWVDAAVLPIQEPMTRIAQTVARWALGALNEVQGFLHDAGAVAISGGAHLCLSFHHQNVSLSAL